MNPEKNERGYILVFATLFITLLLILVGMGLDTGHLTFVRSQGQRAVDAAALAAASAIPSNDWLTVTEQVKKFNPGGSNPASGNDYVSSPTNLINNENVTLIKYEPTTGKITSGVPMEKANGVRVALENNNPYGGTAGAAMETPLFLMPLLNLIGETTTTTAHVSVSAVAAIRALPGLPIVVAESLCGKEANLDFQSGGKSNSGWQTYYVQNASAQEIRNLWRALPFCSGQPIVDIGFCGYLQNGVDATIFNEILKPMFKAHPDRCYLIPVIKSSGNFNQCQTIIDWASFCPDKENAFPATGQLYGTVTCGQSTWTSRDTQCYVPLLVRDKLSGM